MLDILKTLFEKLFNFDTNITSFEKMQNKYKIGRKKWLLLCCTLFIHVSLIFSCSYFIYTKSPVDFTIIFILITFGLLPLTWLFHNHVGKLVLILAYILFPIYLCTVIVSLYFNGLTIGNFFIAIILFLFLCLIYSSIYLFTVDKLTMRQNFKVRFELDNGESVDATLISITKNNDYIVNLDGSDAEILLNKDYIRKIIYNKVENELSE